MKEQSDAQDEGYRERNDGRNAQHSASSATALTYLPVSIAYLSGCRVRTWWQAPSPGRWEGAVTPAEMGDICSAAASAGVRAAATGEQGRGRRPLGFSLDAKPRGAILPERLGGMASA